MKNKKELTSVFHGACKSHASSYVRGCMALLIRVCGKGIWLSAECSCGIQLVLKYLDRKGGGRGRWAVCSYRRILAGAIATCRVNMGILDITTPQQREGISEFYAATLLERYFNA